MRKILFTILLFSTAAVQAQFVTQSAEGKSSLPLPLNGAGISVDVGKAEAVFGINNYDRVFRTDTNRFFYGVSLTGKNAGGFAKLFDAGEIVGEGNLLSFAGYSWSNNSKLFKIYTHNPLWKDVGLANDTMRTYQFTRYPDSICLTVSHFSGLIKDENKREYIINMLTEKVRSLQSDKSTSKIQVMLDGFGAGDPDLRLYMDSMKIAGQRIRAYFGDKIDEVDTRKGKIIGEIQKTQLKENPWRLSLFMMGGIRARSFKRYLGTSIPDFSKSFQDTLYRGGHFGVGVNFLYRDLTFGITYSYNKTDNFDNLTSKEYTIRKTDTSGNSAFIQEKKVTAYAGKYSRVEVNELNADVLISLKLNPSDTARLLLNPYIRAVLFSRDTAYLKNYTNIGLGAFFLGKNRKFIGGLYVELPDINNNAEKAKPVEEQNIQSPFKKLSFGIVTKFNLSSIFGFTDKPRKPD